MLLHLLLITAALADPLPNLYFTPGVARTDITQQQICATKWRKDARFVDEAMKKKIFKEYSFPLLDKDPRCPCEIDHLISRELGGASALQNLWVQSYSGDWNAHMKDRLENRLHSDVCNGLVGLQDAQKSIVADWTKLWMMYFGK